MAEAVAEGTHGYLQQAIGEDEGTLHPPPFGWRKVEVAHDARTRHTDVDAVQEGHHAQYHEHREDCILTGHFFFVWGGLGVSRGRLRYDGGGGMTGRRRFDGAAG